MKVGYFGEVEGSYTQKITRKEFPKAESVPFALIEDVVEAVEHEEIDFGVVPFENRKEGGINPAFDSLVECEMAKIIWECCSVIDHCLGALPDYGKIERIFSNYEILRQCNKFLRKNYHGVPKHITLTSAHAAKKVSEEEMLDAIAIASEDTLELYGLEVIAEDICPNNITRFMILGREKTKPTGRDKTLLVIHPRVRDEPGTLVRCLIPFAKYGLNLELMQSRPDEEKGYRFYVELNGYEDDEKVKMALSEIDSEDFEVKILGSYRDSGWRD